MSKQTDARFKLRIIEKFIIIDTLTLCTMMIHAEILEIIANKVLLPQIFDNASHCYSCTICEAEI
jgi:hypothetical protein